MLSLSCRHILVATVLMTAAFSVVAQGAIRPQPSTRPPGGGDPRDRRPAPPDYRLYEYGKEVYAVKLGCAACPLGDKPLDEITARRFLNDETLGYSLSFEEYDAVTVFLRQRFGLPG